ncbi:MAG TPA: alpha/beta hydrolase [Thermomicrobiales bacterium]|nr:alpha/beta hydrolase [Thermomicrobiales bacterium]
MIDRAANLPFPEVDGVRHRFVSVNGIRFHVAEAGEGEPLLMLHGWPQHWYEWRHLMAALRDDYRVICPDLRGFGWSDVPATGYEKERLVDDILGILDRLGIERVRLIGHDWGGWLGFLLCLRRPEQVERFLALAILHPWLQFDLTLLRNSWRFGYQGFLTSPLIGAWLVQRPGLIDQLIRLDSANGGQWRKRDLRWYSALLQDPARARASVLLYRTFLLREMLPILRGRYRATRLHVPTHVLTGARDLTITPALLRGYAPYADAMTVEVVPDAGHFLPEECPALVAERARAFFS